VDRDQVLVIGFGSELRGDDGMGRAAARRLRSVGFQALAVQQLTPEIAERLAAAHTVFFLDADGGVAPGEIAVETLQGDAFPSLHPVEHQAAPAALLRLARDAYGANPIAWLVAMGGSGFEIGDGLSKSARKAVSRAVEEVCRAVEGARNAPLRAGSADPSVQPGP